MGNWNDPPTGQDDAGARALGETIIGEAIVLVEKLRREHAGHCMPCLEAAQKWYALVNDYILLYPHNEVDCFEKTSTTH